MQGSMACCSSFMKYLKCSDLQRERNAAVYGAWEEGMGSNCEVAPRCWLGIRSSCKRLNGRTDWFFSLQPQPCHGVINAGLFVYFRYFFKFILMCISLLSAYMFVTTCMLVPAEGRREC